MRFAMGEVVDLKPTRPDENFELIADCCRYSENIMSEDAVRKKWRYSEAEWEKLGADAALLEAIELEKVRRIRSGQQKRERAQVLITKGPDILDSIASDESASPRHRVDAIKTLDSFTGNTPEAAAAADRYIITINLGGDHVEHYNKSLTVTTEDPDDISHNSTPGHFVPGAAPQPKAITSKPAAARSKTPEEIAIDSLIGD
jgi:hypothetical protein